MSGSYLWLKLIHVIAVIIWVGGTTLFALLAGVFSRDAAAMGMMGRFGNAAGTYLLMPGSILTLLTGIIMMIQVGGHPPIWMIWGLVAGPLSGFIGGMFIRKTGMALAESMAAGTNERSEALGSRLKVLTAANVALLFSAVVMMVLKPTL